MATLESPPVIRSAPRRRKWWPWLLTIVLIGAAAWVATRTNWITTATNSAKSATGSKAGRGPLGARVVPVVASEVRRGDMPVYLDGLGSVSAFNTVTIRTRVDGELINVA